MQGVRLLEDVAGGMSEVLDILDKGEQRQSTPRREAIAVINQMCDALQAGVDVIAHQITATTMEFSELSRQRLDGAASAGELAQRLHGLLARTAVRLSDPALRVKFYEGGVCGAMHALGDRLSQPLGAVGTSPAWEVAKALFTRTTTMSRAVQALTEGEQEYLREFVGALDEIRDRAEAAAGRWGDEDEWWREAEGIMAALRQKRSVLARQAAELRESADAVIRRLH